ncbi:succinate-semialdehyde dehydrogenase [Colletotrichum costaricense]|uniref:succinate-semialdehyde dehydrogenase [NAD(P)(+)] n=1 Tax=Colletotrichum costaricense TaxID=1209916 RepID=A0AAI9YLW3_9PEZI|nr:succinate-semialdehyde dehydrogenase [Colletotrichum costaricense]KAK1515351.1 succinate-semialdehyde dehydrogenase [Colletotrichum costaricense]
MATLGNSIFPWPLKNQSLVISKGLVNGEWREGRTRFEVYEPSTGNVLDTVSGFNKEDVVEAIESAYTAFQAFRHTTAKERAMILWKWHDLIRANADDLAKLISLENGKALPDAVAEVNATAGLAAWFAEEAVRSYGDVIPSSFPNTTVMTFREPVGVCAIVTPWNFPAMMVARKIAPAFAAGCSVVIKPPSETPFSVLALAKLALDAGLPRKLLHVLPTKDRNAATELARHPLVAKLSFTGSTPVGIMLTQLAAATMKRVSMELGGNAPFIVFEDADIDVAVQAAVACKFRASGQVCVSANRLIVHESVVADFATKLTAAVAKFRLGRGIDSGVTHGPLVNAAAVAKIDSHVKDALSRGAKLWVGGKRPENINMGFFYEPTVLTNVPRDALVAHDETFGPLGAIISFKTQQEALDIANNTDLGLAGYFFSRNVGRVLEVARALEVGMVGVNTGIMTAPETPFGGVKLSGLGREGSKHGISEYQNIKSITISHNF